MTRRAGRRRRSAAAPRTRSLATSVATRRRRSATRGTFKCACTDTDGSPDPGTNPDPGTDTGPDPGTDTGPDPGPDTGERRFLEDYQDPEWVHLEIELDRILFARR